MSNASIVLVGIALCLCSPPCGSLAAALPAASPVANKLLFGIASEDEICPVKNIIVESRYVKNCDEARLPVGRMNLTVEDPERFLCLGVYDRIATLCYLDSFRKGGKTVLPESSTEFDDLVAKLPATDKESYEFCSRSKNPYPPRYEKTKVYAEQLNKAMAMPGLCIKMCIYDDGNFNRLCSVIAAIEDISLRVAHSSEKSPKQETKDTVVKEKTVEHTAKAESALEEPIPDKPKEAAAKTEDKAAPKPGPSADKEDADKNKKQSQPSTQPQPQPQPQYSEPAPKIAKPAAVHPPAAPKETPRNEKETKIEEPETAAKPPAPAADVGSDKKSDVQPPTSKNPLIDADHLPISGEDAPDGYLGGTDNIGPLPDDPTNGEQISEHTQEQEDQDVGEETSDIDPPLIPPNEQVDESPPVPSEKREFVPRMPSIRNDDDSHFFGYFTVIGVICIAGYVGYHNKQKILAMVLEGRRSRGGRGRRRPSTANYRKLDCTLEEAVTSQCNSNVTHVIY